MRKLKLAVLGLVVLLGVAQAFRIDKTNPPVEAAVSAPPAVTRVMQRSCFNCHSNQTVWPWYSNVAPMSWLLASDVHDGRAHLNFSRWGNYTVAQRQKKLKEITKEIATGDMPPLYYVYPMHLNARLSAADRRLLTAWTASEAAALEQPAAASVQKAHAAR